MSSNALSSFGTLVKKGDGGAPESFTTIAELMDISGPGLELSTEDVTSHSSPGAWSEFIGTILTAGEVSFEINYIPTDATHDASTGLIADMINRVRRNFVIVFPDTGNTTWSFTALVTKVEPTMAVKGILTGKITLKISGQPVLVQTQTQPMT